MLNVGANKFARHAAESDASDPVQAQNKQYKTEIASHQAQLEALKQQDPEFYDYLQQTDQELLNFGQDDDEEEAEEEEQEEMANASEDDQVGLGILCTFHCGCPCTAGYHQICFLTSKDALSSQSFSAISCPREGCHMRCNPTRAHFGRVVMKDPGG